MPWRTNVVSPSGADWVHEIKHDGYRMIALANFQKAIIFL